MKNNEIIPQYIQDEINNLVKKKSSYTKEEIDQIKRDFDHVIEQRKQLEEAENFGVIPKEEAAINRIFLMAKQLIIQDTMEDALKYMKRKVESLNKQIKELKQYN
jgi:hypothetical protein